MRKPRDICARLFQHRAEPGNGNFILGRYAGLQLGLVKALNHGSGNGIGWLISDLAIVCGGIHRAPHLELSVKVSSGLRSLCGIYFKYNKD